MIAAPGDGGDIPCARQRSMEHVWGVEGAGVDMSQCDFHPSGRMWKEISV